LLSVFIITVNIMAPEGDKVYVRNYTIICIEGCEMKTKTF